MGGAPGSSNQPTKRSVQEMQNSGFDETFGVPTFELLGWDSVNNVLRRIAVDASGQLKTNASTLFVLKAGDSMTGALGINQATPLAALHVSPLADNAVGIYVRGTGTQTGDLQRWYDTTGLINLSVNSAGVLQVANDLIFQVYGSSRLFRLLYFNNAWADNTRSAFFQVADGSDTLNTVFTGAGGAALGRLLFSANGGILFTDALYNDATHAVSPAGALINFRNSTGGNVVAVFRGATGQSGSLSEWRNVGNTALVTITAAGALTITTSLTAPTSVLTPLVAPSSGTLTLQGLDGSAPTVATLRGGNGGGISATAGANAGHVGGTGGGGLSGNANGGNAFMAGGAKLRSGTDGSAILYKSDQSTKVVEVNTAGLGFFAAATVAQQTGDIGAGLVNLGLFSSTTSTSNVVSTGRQTAQTAADANVLTFAVPAADHSYLITSNILVTTSTLHSFTATCSYTDESNTARVLTLNFSQLTGAFVTAITNGTGVGAYEGVPVNIRAKASTNIVIATTGTFTGVTYNVEAAVIQVT